MTPPAGVVDRIAARMPRTEVLLVWLLVAHVVLKLLIYPLTMDAPAYNDEQQYYDGARALSNLVRDTFAFNAPDGAELERNVVGSGWFMPGMAILMTPLFVVFPDAADPLAAPTSGWPTCWCCCGPSGRSASGSAPATPRSSSRSRPCCRAGC